MKTLIKLASQNRYVTTLRAVLFDGNTARATDCDTFAIMSGPWNFTMPVMVPIDTIKTALAMGKGLNWDGKTLNGMRLTGSAGDVNSYPVAPSDTTGAVYSLPITPDTARVLSAMGVADVRYFLNGLFVNNGTIAATDGNRLHRLGVVSGTTGAPAVIIPRALFDVCKKPIRVDYTGKIAVMHGADGVTYTAKLIDGKFPDIDRATPARRDRPIETVVTDAMIETLQRMTAAVKISDPKSGGVIISADGAIGRDDKGITPVPFCAPVPGGTGVRALHLLEAMRAAGAGGKLCMSGSLDSMYLVAGDFKAVVMSMRV